MFLVSWVFGMRKSFKALAVNLVLGGSFVRVKDGVETEEPKVIIRTEMEPVWTCQMPPELDGMYKIYQTHFLSADQESR